MTKTYDYIVTGGGAAGRSLICQLLNSSLRDKRILMIDREPKLKNDRTWCFWEQEPGFFDAIVHHSWDQLWIHTDEASRLLDIAPFRYKLIKGIDFYRFTDELINKHANVERLFGKVEAITPSDTGVEVVVDGKSFSADWCFNSIFFGAIDKDKVNYLDQHFLGWFIRTDSAAFDPKQAALMDFRTPQMNEFRFLYVLPYSPQEALIETAIFSNNHLQVGEYEQILKEYINAFLPDISPFKILQREMGNIPMTDYPFQTSDGRVIHLGMAGGDTRAASGYTFYYIQKRVAAIIRNLIKSGNPLLKESRPMRRARFYDKLMLRVLDKGYYPGDALFRKLFANNPPQRVLSFLNAETTLLEEVKLTGSLPKWPFLRALVLESAKMGSILPAANLPHTSDPEKATNIL